MSGEVAPSRSASTPPEIDGRFVRQVFRLVKIAFHTQPRRSAVLAVALLAFVAGQKFLEYYIGLIPSQFYQVLPERNQNAFLHLLGKSLGFIVGIALVKSIAMFLTKLAYISWRRDLVIHLQGLYLKHNSYFFLNCVDKTVDNPDQRITQDVDRFCKTFSEQILKLIVSPFTIVFYSYKTWSQVGWFAPVLVYLFFIFGLTINRLLLSLVTPLVVQQEKLEGDFRYHHVQLRRRAEAVAFCNAGRLEGRKLLSTYMALYTIQLKIMVRELYVLISVNGFDYLGSMLSYFIIAVPILSGSYADASLASIISKASFETIYLISQFTQLLDLSVPFGEIAGYCYRINGLLDALESRNPSSLARKKQGKAAANKKSSFISRLLGCFFCCSKHGAYNQSTLVPSTCSDDDDDEGCNYSSAGTGSGWRPTSDGPRPVFHLDAVSYGPPCRNAVKTLVKDLSLDILPTSGLLITGRTGSGKSSLLRALKGLWPVKGDIWRWHGSGKLMFLPQQPFLTQGSLAQQVAYPDLVPSVTSLRRQAADGDMSVDLGEHAQQMRSSLDTIGECGTSPLLLSVSNVDVEDNGNDSEILSERVESCLKRVGLDYLISRANRNVSKHLDWEWYDTLSPGEVQRLAFARLLYQRPAMAFLDESTSALDDDAAHEMLKECKILNITLVAVVHHHSAYEKEFFSNELKLHGDGGWSLKAL